MAILNVNPTRLELIRTKKRLATAIRGHRLLKDKRDELIRRFSLAANESLKLRREVEQAISSADAHMAIAASLMSSEQTATALMMSGKKAELDIKTKNVMGIKLPSLTLSAEGSKGESHSYGYAFTSGELDEAVDGFSKISDKLIKLAETEKMCQLMADEIEKTRRRVNALEYIMIPRYEDTVRFITAKLEENERSAAARLTRI